MNKIVYSGFVKFVAVVLFVASIVCGVLTAANGMFAFFEEDEDIYDGAGDFSQSWYVSYMLNEPENVIFNAYRSVLYHYDDRGYLIHLDDAEVEERRDELASAIEENVRNIPDDQINYYIQWNDMVLILF